MPARRRAAALASHVAPVTPGAAAAAAEGSGPPADPAAIAQLPGQQLTAPGTDGYVFTHRAGMRGGAEGAVPLTAAQRDAYERDGFLLVKGCVPVADLRRYQGRFAELASGAEIPAGMQVVRDLGSVRQGKGRGRTPATASTINKVQNLETDAVLWGYAHHPNVLQYVPAFTGPAGAKALPFTSMLVNKPPDVGMGTSRHPIHQDLWFWPVRPAGRCVAAWTAVERVWRGNGALFAIPGTHKGALMPHAKPTDGPVNAGFVGIAGQCDESAGERPDAVWLEMDPGDTVFFHPLLWHGSGRNTSEVSRQAISVHYIGTDCVYFDPAQDPVQCKRAERIAATGGHQYGDGGPGDIIDLYRRRLRGGGRNSTVLFGAEGSHPAAV